MSRRKQTRKGKPVSAQITRAAKRAFPNGAPKSGATESDPTQALAAAENVLGLAERVLETAGEFSSGPESILREGLRAAAQEFDVIGLAVISGSGVPSMAFIRAMARCEFALSLAEYRARYGYPVDAEGLRIRPRRVDEQKSEAQS